MINRRQFIGGLTLALGNISVSYGDYNKKMTPNNNAVIYLFLGGGASHIETFNPIPLAPIERRSITGHINTRSGFQIGGLFTELAKRSDDIAVVRGFYHKDSNHSTATHWVMSGAKNQGGSTQNYPSYGSMVSGYYGPTTRPYGMPTYVKLNQIDGDGSAWMGTKFMGYEAGKGIEDLKLKLSKDRFLERAKVLYDIETLSTIDQQGWGELQSQAVDVITGKASEAFDISKDAEYDKYKVDQLHKDALTAIRVVENGAKVVTINYGGWDMHDNILSGLQNRQPPLDHCISLLIDSLKGRGLSNVMLVVTSEFGRTPKINGNSGRDHWSGSVPLLISSQQYEMGRVIGGTNALAEVAEDGLCTPEDLRWTILSHLGIERNNTWLSIENRPMPITGSNEKNILTEI